MLAQNHVLIVDLHRTQTGAIHIFQTPIEAEHFDAIVTLL